MFCEDKNGKLITCEDKILKRYFTTSLNIGVKNEGAQDNGDEDKARTEGSRHSQTSKN